MSRHGLLVTTEEVERFNEVCESNGLAQSIALEMSIALDEARLMIEMLELVKQGRAVPYLAACQGNDRGACMQHRGGITPCESGQLRFTLTDAGRDALVGKVSALILAEVAQAKAVAP